MRPSSARGCMYTAKLRIRGKPQLLEAGSYGNLVGQQQRRQKSCCCSRYAKDEKKKKVELFALINLGRFLKLNLVVAGARPSSFFSFYV